MQEIVVNNILRNINELYDIRETATDPFHGVTNEEWATIIKSTSQRCNIQALSDVRALLDKLLEAAHEE